MFPGIPSTSSNQSEQNQRVAGVVNKLNQGKFNCTLAVTLKASSTSTTVTDIRIGYNSLLLFMPQTAHAAAELASGNLYVPQSTMIAAINKTPGTAVIQHTNNAQTDRTFVMGILG